MGIVKLTPVLKDYLWGGNKLEKLFGRRGGGKIAESWEASVHHDGVSGAEGGTFLQYLAQNKFAVNARGDDFPVLIKFIDAAQNLSVQVHPNDDYARKYENDNGKTEMWYIVQADDGAGIYCGFKRDTCREEVLSRVADGTIDSLLNFIPVRAGDCYLIRSGTVHAIGAGCVICEVQQSSNVTYRVYDYNRRDKDGKLRQLHVQKAADVIDYSAFRDVTGGGEIIRGDGYSVGLLTECEYFRCRLLDLDGSYRAVADRSFIALNVLDGAGTVCGRAFARGDCFFVPFGDKLELSGRAKIILTECGV